MKKEKPLVDSTYLLEKIPGKGGWTYAAIPEVLQSKETPFGWVRVKGSIDGYEVKQYKLMPMGNGQLFLPVKAQIRKKIKKEAGDTVKIILYADDSELEIPADILACFDNEAPSIKQTFRSFSEGQQKAYLKWIAAAKKEETKANRIAEMMCRLEDGLKFGQ